MPTRAAPYDPLTTAAPLETSLRGRTSQQSLRSNTSASSARNMRQRPARSGGGGSDKLFAPSLSRRPTSRATPRVEDDVLADPSDSDDELPRDRRRGRRGSPAKSRQDPVAGGDIVNRRENGSYLLDYGGERPQGFPVTTAEAQQEADQADQDAHFAQIAKYYFTSGQATGSRHSKKQEEEFQAMAAPMLLRLREQAMQKIEGERWLHEATKSGQGRM